MPAEKGRAAPALQDGVISSLAARTGRSDRIAVCLDGSFAFDLAAALVEQVGLHTGDLLSVEMQQRLVNQDSPHRARAHSLRLLAMHDRSVREMESRLREGAFDSAVISSTIVWLEELGYLDDRRFAARYAGEKLRGGWGPRRVRAELLRRGVERSVVDETLDTEGENAPALVDGAEGLLGLARKRFGRQLAVDPDGTERRLAGFLARRGYDWEAIGTVVRILRLEAAGGEEASDRSDASSGSNP